MPIYEFVCQECGHEFEQILPFSASQVPTCPSCRADAVRRRVGRPAIHFKGSGWYITDSKKDHNGAGRNGAKDGKSQQAKESTSASDSSSSND